MEQNKKKYDYLIVGAGLFGSTFARLACDDGKKCLVVDKRSHVGGNCYSRKIQGIDVHMYGPHIFHTSRKETWEFVDSLSPMRPFFNQPLAVFNDEIYNLPFNMNTFRQIYGNRTVGEISLMIKQDIIPCDDPLNLEEFALATVGVNLYRKLIRGYTEKQWGRKCSELPASFIKRLPLRMSYDNCYFSDQYQGVPQKGYDHLFERLLEGCDVLLCCDFLENQDYLQGLAKRVLYTGRLDNLYDAMDLEFRGLEFRHRFIDPIHTQGCAVVNYTDSLVRHTRVTEHVYFNPPAELEESVQTFEYPIECTMPHHIECYPIPTERNLKLYEKYRRRVEADGDMIIGGRLADYRYYNMDTTIEKAIELWKREKSQTRG